MRIPCKAVILLFTALTILAAPRVSLGEVGIGISISIGPPPLPVYVQPACPGPRFIWVPGYWAWAAGGYYWVPGTWVLAPRPGLLWTPGYWGWHAGLYAWHPGYWGPRVGYYGGINYGFGYTGVGYVGGYWHGGMFYYNRSVNNVNVRVIHNTYYRTVVRNVTVNRVSYSGGPGGIALRPTRAQEVYARERHFGLTRSQIQHERTAQEIRALRAAVNHGRPTIAATARPGAFRGHGVMPAVRAGGRYRSRTTFRPGQRFARPSQQPYRRNNRPYRPGLPNGMQRPHPNRGPVRRPPGRARPGRPQNRRRANPGPGREHQSGDRNRGYGRP
ncbi:MAG: YXWGXW repeat-containing protein [Gammaproteobacteria bacterium]|nr:YXWGXW repeat-containing protein [Gammaproteobacteria bacterium]